MAEDKIFANGFGFKRREGAPEWHIGKINIKVDDAIEFLEQHQNQKGWVSLDVNTSKSGNHYLELDQWVPPVKEEDEAPEPEDEKDEPTDDLPF